MDIFEQIRSITTPKGIQPPKELQTPRALNIQADIARQAALRGIQAVNQVRQSVLPRTQLQSPAPIMTPRIQPAEQRMSLAPRRIQAIPPAITPPIKSISALTPQPFQLTGVKRELTQPEQAVAKFFGTKSEPAGKFAENIAQAFNVAKKGEGLTKVEKALKGVQGLGNIVSLGNEFVIQPVWDSIKLGIKAGVTGRITENDINDFIFSTGGQKGTLFQALGTNEQDFANKYGDVALQTARFLDFAPELIDPLQITTGGKTATLAREVKLGKEALEDAGQLAKKDEINKAIAKFEESTRQKLSNEAVDSIKKTVDNPKEFITDIAKKGEVTGELGGIPPSGTIPTEPLTFKTIPTKQRKFPKTVEKAEGTAKEVKNILKDRIDLYSPIKNKDEFARATKFVNENEIDNVIDYIKYAEDPREISYIGQALMSKLQKEGNYARVIDVLDIVSEQGTKSGQAIQALSVWGRLTPEGALRTAQNTVRKYNSDNKLVEGMKGYIKLSDSQIKEISDQAKLISKTTDEIDRLREISVLQNLIAKVIPGNIGEKISTFQTLAQLLNPKTFIRNVLGNALFGTIDSITQTFATPLDLAVSLFTKKRTVAPASIRRQFKGGAEGLKIGLQEALAGANTSNLSSQFDLPNASVFDSKIMQGLEKALNVTLRAPDRAFYEATYKDTLEGLMKLDKVDTPTKEMMEIAHYEALRRTFQDENAVSKFFQSQKQSWNRLGIKGFGLGDLILKYPKTPANLLVRSAEYTPLGYVTAVYELARPLMGQAFNQRAFVNNIARASVGTGIINLGYALGKLGIISPRPDSDTDARNAQDLQGLKSYSFNTSALKRYVLSAFDSEAAKPRVGDQLFSYDWAQPAVLPLAMGANMAENDGKVKNGSFADKVMLSFGPLASEIINSSDTLTEQPLLQGLQTLYNTRNIQEGLINTLVSAAGSFVPTILNQINQYTDNASRETYSPDYFKSAYNKFAARIPLLAQKLPQRADILGRPKERFPNASNTFFNVFFNPGFVDQIKADPTLNEVISLYEETGEKTQFPRVVQKSITVNGERRLLDTQEIVDYQTNLGQLSNSLISSAMTNKKYQDLPTTEKALFIGNVLSDANKIAKINLFGEDSTDISGRLDMLLNNDLTNYLDETLSNKQEQLRKEQLKAQGLSYKKGKLPAIKKPRTGRRITVPKPKKPRLAKIKLPKIKKPKRTKLASKTKPKKIKPVNLA
jgi:hypothetical protein